MIFNELIENVEQMKLKNKKLEVSLNLKIFFIYTVFLYRMRKNLPSSFLLPFFPQKSKTLFDGHIVIADSFLGTAVDRYRKV